MNKQPPKPFDIPIIASESMPKDCIAMFGANGSGAFLHIPTGKIYRLKYGRVVEADQWWPG